MTPSRQIVTKLLNQAGITVNGSREHDMQIHDEKCFDMILNSWSLGLGESYMQGMWTSKKLDTFFSKLFSSSIDHKFFTKLKPTLIAHSLKYKFLNLQNIRRAFEVGQKHYDLGNNFFENMLDPNMQYSCGYWEKANNLKDAQINKLDMVCQKLKLKPGDHVLEIGCGWGGFAKYAIKKYKINYTGISISEEQILYAKKHLKNLKANFILSDYRSIQGVFDKVVSIGMFEHVGQKNYRDYFEVAFRSLKKDGLFLLHTIGTSQTKMVTDPWIHKYIFPNGYIPSYNQIAHAAEGFFHLEDWHNFGKDYDLTLQAWYENFKKNWKKNESNYPNTFYKMWEYYLLSCAGYFRSKRGQLWQIVFSRINSQQKYVSYRPKCVSK
jgi:cyclopropane-fatty-acyl-phospholipid synthase